MGTPPGSTHHLRALRGDAGGWSLATSRRNTKFLYAVDERALTGVGFALSLTIRDCPPSSDDWAAIRRAFIKRLERLGLIRLHWLTEWQSRGCPHLHAAVWLDVDAGVDLDRLPYVIRDHWLAVAGKYGSAPRGQHVVPVTDSVGWFKYLAKHATRGAGHYQRSADSVPAGWVKTGRMWGHVGAWPIQPPRRFGLSREGHFVLRRLIRSWRVAAARASGETHRLQAARRMLRCHVRQLSEVRGISTWIREDVQELFMLHLGAIGYSAVPESAWSEPPRAAAELV